MANGLLNNDFAPVTHSWGFLESDWASVLGWFDTWLESLPPPWECNVHHDVTLRGALALLEPLNLAPYLVIETHSPWTAVFMGHPSGPQSAIPHLSKTNKCRGVFVSCVPDTYDPQQHRGTWGAVQFMTYAANSKALLNDERTVQAVNESGKWRFESSGVAYPFEDVSKYDARLVKDRFSCDMLQDYCDNLGIKLFDEEFYGPNSTIYRRDDDLGHDVAAETYSSLQHRLRITVP